LFELLSFFFHALTSGPVILTLAAGIGMCSKTCEFAFYLENEG
jgi:hypothetical protein